MAVPAERVSYRFAVLLFNCLLTFGSYFCFDMPSVLQQQLQGNLTCPNGTHHNSTGHNGTLECVEGLGMTPAQYNLLYAIYAWTNAVVVILAGFLIDKLGNHFVQNRITAFWFKGKELALAFGLTLSFSRLGSVLNFFFTQQFEAKFGMQWTLWGGSLLCVLGLFSAITVSVLDKVGMKQLGLDGIIQQESKKVRIQDIQHLPLRYWLLVLTIMFFYNGVFPFVADASKFIQDKYPGYSQQAAAYIAGAVYDSSLVLSAAVGILIDYVGLRGVFAVGCATLTLPVFALLAFTFVPPLVSTIWLGITYSFAAASMWPSIPLVVPQATLGTAMGLATSVQMVGVGLSNLIVGHMLGTKSSELKIPLWRWQQMMIFMLANTVACIIASIGLNVVDKKQDETLNRTRKGAPMGQDRDPADAAQLLEDETRTEGSVS
ncbi:major facilitator superfamily domain-containing protein 1-like isoform X3 [Manacus vitellinus]|uniref:major facilitator superfamily domain-containing protein 1-like isoform X3 n=1 Tax=Manacus vitellinus TaxID=328815 RepID=UPI00115C6A15|nr:major facilitator superfamily domain-containing protein 1-like isoform X3 [Manacus vitellinus]